MLKLTPCRNLILSIWYWGGIDINKKSLQVGILFFIIILLIISLKNEDSDYFNNYPYNYEGYKNSQFSNDYTAFIFKYPKNWIVKEMEIRKGSQTCEADSELGGVEVYFDANSERPILEIYRNSSHFHGVYDGSFEKKDPILIDNEKIADIWMEKENKAYINICVTYRDTYEGASLFVEKDIYDNYKEEIFTILSSIKFYDIY